MKGSEVVTLKRHYITVTLRNIQITVPPPPYTSFNDIPDDVLVEIICRLEIKHMTRCMCVSKLWNLLITEVCIPRITLSPVYGIVFSTVQSPTYKKGQWNIAYVNSFNDHQSRDTSIDKSFLHYKLPFRPSPEAFLDCCDGLLLYFDKASMQYYVYNPSTQQYITIPNSPGNRVPTTGVLFFDSHYKVMNISGGPPTTNIFSLVTHEWSVHNLDLESSIIDHPVSPRYIFSCGSVYRLSVVGYLVEFDIKQNRQHVYALPDIVRRCEPIGCLGVSQGILHYGWEDQDSSMMIWTVKAKSDHPAEWVLKYTIPIQYFRQHPISRHHRGFPFFNVVAFHPTSDMIFVASYVGVFSYDPCAKKLESLFETSEGNLIFANQYYVYLFSPNITPSDAFSRSTIEDSADLTTQMMFRSTDLNGLKMEALALRESVLLSEQVSLKKEKIRQEEIFAKKREALLQQEKNLLEREKSLVEKALALKQQEIELGKIQSKIELDQLRSSGLLQHRKPFIQSPEQPFLAALSHQQSQNSHDLHAQDRTTGAVRITDDDSMPQLPFADLLDGGEERQLKTQEDTRINNKKNIA